jgi:hypothetical protein
LTRRRRTAQRIAPAFSLAFWSVAKNQLAGLAWRTEPAYHPLMLRWVQDPAKDTGRTWPDFLHEHATAGVLLTSTVAVTVMFLVGLVFVFVAYKRAVKEGRSFDAWGGYLFKLGSPTPTTSASNSSVSSTTRVSTPGSGHLPAAPTRADAALDPPSRVARGALALVRAAQAIAIAPSSAEANDREGYFLTALHESTKHHEGTTRRASILKVIPLPGSDEAMSVHHGFPESSFVRPHTQFLRTAFERDGAGLCWAAVHACRAGHSTDSIKRNVFHAPDVSRESSFVRVPGHHAFQSVLIAPVHVAGRLLGVVCLDSEQTAHYEEEDQYLIALAALALGTAWQARRMAGRTPS